uniref:Uncharacterized protein n=1 Tax=Fagus sylvatica TaxID=28930 RepID=A0A2N9GBT9_FAGSY
MDFPFFVGYPPDPPDTHIEIKSPPPPISFLSLSLIFSAASLTPSLHHPHASITALLPHGITALLPHRITALLPHRITASPAHPSFLPLFHRHKAAVVQPLSRRLLEEKVAVMGWF